MTTQTKEPKTEIATIETSGYLALQDGGAIAEAMEANLGADTALQESDLTRVPIPTGGGTTWLVPGLMEDEPVQTLDGVLVYMCVRGVLWPSDTPKEGTLPMLVSHDLKTAKFVMDPADVPSHILESMEPAQNEDGTYRWADLPQCEWGTGKNGIGKAAKEQRVLYILRERDPLPLVVVIQPGSLKDWKKFVIALTKAGVPYYRAVISLGLEKATADGGELYSKVVPKLTGTLTPENGDVIREKFTGPMREVANSSFSG